jgi:hopanoid biosynthesis associated radical SAM protein HpnH
MKIPYFKEVRIGAYLLKQKLLGRKRYPLVLMLEPLFRCNLACAGCGKIDYPDPILNRRLSVEECLEAVDECGAPMVAIPGGEPLIHRDIGEIVKGIVARRKFVSLCTNALLLDQGGQGARLHRQRQRHHLRRSFGARCGGISRPDREARCRSVDLARLCL